MDTVAIPAWSGTGAYPTVTVRLDFRNPEIAGTFVFHCHILDHEDGGIMAKIRVLPRGRASYGAVGVDHLHPLVGVERNL